MGLDDDLIKRLVIACIENNMKLDKSLSRLINDSLTAPVFVCDQNMKAIEYANPSLLNVTGYSMEQILELDPKVFYQDYHDEYFLTRLADLVNEQEILFVTKLAINYTNRQKVKSIGVKMKITPIRYRDSVYFVNEVLGLS